MLRHFLEKLGFDRDFCKQLTDWLEVWTATERGIFHNHGIPQGPLSSGLLSEVVLSHFDSLKSRRLTFHYFRYVDDIRLFAKSEKDLRQLLVTLDLLSKDIGLFPQSGKISIHRVRDIEKELKSVSNPSELSIIRRQANQKKLFKRIVELTPRFKIADSTRFKYLLAHAEPRAPLTAHLWRILQIHPEIYQSVCNYLRRYQELPRVPADKIVEVIKANGLYQSVRAEFIAVADFRLPATQKNELAEYLRVQWVPRNLQADLVARVSIYLMRTGHITPRQYIFACGNGRSWWTRATLVDTAESNHLGESARADILHKAIKDLSCDVAIAASWKTFFEGISLTNPQSQWNPSGAKK